MAGRPPKPISIHEIQGTKRKHRHGTRSKSELRLDSKLPEPPKWLMVAAKEEWRRLLRDSAYASALTAADFTSLAIYCQMWGRFIEAEKKDLPLKPSFISSMINLGGKLGLTPSDRAKFRGPEETKPKTGWAQFRTPIAG